MIPIQQYIGSLRRRGVRLWLDGENLRYQAPKDSLSSADLDELRSRKAELLGFLWESAMSPVPPLRKAPRTGAIPQSFAQQRLWFLHHLNGPDASYNIVDRRRLVGPLDRGAIEASFREICRRHEILRTTFTTVDAKPVQIVSPDPGLDFSFIDCGDLQQIAEQEARHCFDLTRGPLLRVRLVRTGDNDHALLITAHHIVCDGWSLGILFRELSSLYRAFRRSEASPLPAPELHYADYACWQREWLSGNALETRLNYWRHLAGAPVVLDLFPEHPRTASLVTSGAAEAIRIEPGIAGRFRQLCQSHGCTPFMGMAAVFCILLARYTRSRDIVLGTQVTGRDQAGLEPIAGFFVNTLALRIDVDLDCTFEQLLGLVRAVSLDAVAHQDVPFEKVVELLNPERRIGRNPLVQIMLLWQNLPSGALEFDGIRIEPLAGAGRSTAKFDLTLEMGEIDTGAFEGVLEYRTDLYTGAEIRRVAGHIATLVSGIAHDPRRKLRAVPMLPEGEINTLIRTGRGSAIPVSGAATIAGRFEHQVLIHPARLALVFGGEALSYVEVDERASRLAARLCALGIGPEKPAGVFLEPSVELIVAILAVLKSGAFYLPLDTRSPRARLAAVLADSGAAIVLSIERLAGLLPSGTFRTECIDRIEPAGPMRAPRIHPESLAYAIYTSGSTGTPKGVMVAQESVVALADWLGREVYRGNDSPVPTALLAPAVFDASVQQIFGCLLNGHTLFPVDGETRRDGALLRRFFRQHRIGMADCTPSLLSIMCEAGIPGDESLGLTGLLVGGEGLPASLVAEFHRQDRARRITLRNVYGPTECCVDSTCLEVEPADPKEGILAIGKALPHCEIFILESGALPAAQLAPEGVAGEVAIGGSGVGRGYWKQPALTAASFVPHPFEPGRRVYRTGDLGWWNASGAIEFLGRTDDQVKIRGYRIQLSDIETHLLRHPGIRQAAVIARQAREGHRELIAWFAGDAALTVIELRGFLSEALPEYMVPAAFVRLDALPLNLSGKIDRKRLPEPDTAPATAQGSEFVAPAKPAEIALADVWSKVLGRSEIGVRDHYIALGGDSIKALQISARLRDAGWKLELSDLFRHPHIQDLAPLLRPLDVPAGLEIVREAPLTPVQLRFLELFDGSRNFFAQSVLLAADEFLEEGRLRDALEAVYRHHDALRITFANSNGNGWLQRIPETDSPVPFRTAECRAADLPRIAMSLYAEMNLESGPLFRAVLCRVNGAQRLLLAAHHLVIDGVSWRILLEDLESAYRQLAAGATATLPSKTTAFTNWAVSLRDKTAADVFAEYAWPSAAAIRNAALLPDKDGCACPCRECGIHSFKLPESLTGNLLESCHRAYSTEANDLLLTALSRAAFRLRGQRSLAVLMEGHGREPLLPGIDVSRTVGWFTALYPVVLAAGPTGDCGRHIKSVKEKLRAIPRKGVGYGIARYIARDPRLSDSAGEPGVVFNYLGHFGGNENVLFRRAPEETGPFSDPEATFRHDVEINALATGRVLEFHFSYNPNRFFDTTIARLASLYVEELEAIAEHTLGLARTELTPSDIDYDGFSLDEMEAFLDNLTIRQEAGR